MAHQQRSIESIDELTEDTGDTGDTGNEGDLEDTGDVLGDDEMYMDRDPRITEGGLYILSADVTLTGTSNTSEFSPLDNLFHDWRGSMAA